MIPHRYTVMHSSSVRTCIHNRRMPDGREILASDKEISRRNPDGFQGKLTWYDGKRSAQAAFDGCEYSFSEIKAAYQEAVGHSVGASQIYYVLHRHKWRKVMPRSRHPKKASEEVIATSKKLTPESQN